MYWLDVVAILALLVAMFVEFRRGYRYKGRLVMDRISVLRNYHWLRIFLDLLVVVLIGLTLIPQFRFNPLRYIILWRFYYIYRTNQNFFRLVHSKKGWYVFYTFVKMLLIFYMFCHYTGCIYYWIDYYIHSTNYYGPGQDTMMWTEHIYLWSPILAGVWYEQYMYTIYYSLPHNLYDHMVVMLRERVVRLGERIFEGDGLAEQTANDLRRGGVLHRNAPAVRVAHRPSGGDVRAAETRFHRDDLHPKHREMVGVPAEKTQSALQQAVCSYGTVLGLQLQTPQHRRMRKNALLPETHRNHPRKKHN
ncbi:unnamed protein product [Sphagnum balticum]